MADTSITNLPLSSQPPAAATDWIPFDDTSDGVTKRMSPVTLFGALSGISLTLSGLTVTGALSAATVATQGLTSTGVIRNDTVLGGYAMGNVTGVPRMQYDMGTQLFDLLTEIDTLASFAAAGGTFSGPLTVDGVGNYLSVAPVRVYSNVDRTVPVNTFTTIFSPAISTIHYVKVVADDGTHAFFDWVAFDPNGGFAADLGGLMVKGSFVNRSYQLSGTALQIIITAGGPYTVKASPTAF